MNDNFELIKNLQNSAKDILDDLIHDTANVAVLDFPNNTNVGDSLIWLGEMAYLRARGLSPCYVCDAKNYSRSVLQKKISTKNSLILLHGGGNFGTVWPELQSFREQVLKDFPGVRVIQFPQSLHFDNTDRLAETANVIKQHGNFTLLVRDNPSFNLARENFECDVKLCPDMAFFIGQIDSKIVPPFDRFVLSRTDIEKKDNWQLRLGSLVEGKSINVDDWLEPGVAEKIMHRIEWHSLSLRRWLDRDNQFLLMLWNALAKERMARGVALIERGRIVVTDRLHTHILSILLNKPHVLLDNSYGKLGNYFNAWTKNYPLARLVTNVEDAVCSADELDSTLPSVGA